MSNARLRTMVSSHARNFSAGEHESRCCIAERNAILHRIVGVRVFAQHGERHRVRRTDVAFDERFERRRIAVLRPGDEIGIGRLLRLLGRRARLHSVINA